MPPDPTPVAPAGTASPRLRRSVSEPDLRATTAGRTGGGAALETPAQYPAAALKLGRVAAAEAMGVLFRLGLGMPAQPAVL